MKRASILVGLVGLVACGGSPSRAVTAPAANATLSSATLPAQPESPARPRSTPRDAERVVAEMRPGLRRCWERGLDAENPAMQGELTMRVLVRADGSVERADVTSRRGLSPRVASCIQRRVEAARFHPAADDMALELPVKFLKGT